MEWNTLVKDWWNKQQLTQVKCHLRLDIQFVLKYCKQLSQWFVFI